MDEAVPFLLAAVLSASAAAWTAIVEYTTLLRTKALDGENPCEGDRPAHLTPEGVASVAGWAADVGPGAITTAAPLIAGLLLIDDREPGIYVLYAVVLLAAVALFVWGLTRDPVHYVRQKTFGVTRISALGVALNVVIAIALLAS